MCCWFRCGAQSDGDMGFSGVGSAHQNEVVRLVSELARAERFDLGLVDCGGAVVENGEVLAHQGDPFIHP